MFSKNPYGKSCSCKDCRCIVQINFLICSFLVKGDVDIAITQTRVLYSKYLLIQCICEIGDHNYLDLLFCHRFSDFSQEKYPSSNPQDIPFCRKFGKKDTIPAPLQKR